MSQAVIIKSSKCGITLVLDSALPFSELLDEILKRFQASEKFFAHASFAISFEGRILTEEEKYQIIDAIMENTGVDIRCIVEEDELRDAILSQRIAAQEQTEKLRQRVTGTFYYGALSAGERLETDESVVIIGDVPSGACVVSQGDIVILGALRGSAFAGMSGRQGSFISALVFEPEAYNISGIYGEDPPKGRGSFFSRRNKTPLAMLATLSAGIISLNPITAD